MEEWKIVWNWRSSEHLCALTQSQMNEVMTADEMKLSAYKEAQDNQANMLCDSINIS